MPLCHYGCGKEGKYKQTSGKICCEKLYTQCPEVRKRNSNSSKGKPSLLLGRRTGPISEERKKSLRGKKKSKPKETEDLDKLCDYGCGNKAKYRFKNGKYCCSKHQSKCLVQARKIACSWNKEKREKLREEMINGGAKYAQSFITIEGKERQRQFMLKYGSEIKTIEGKERQRQFMLNGGAAHAASKVKNDSKPENELFKIICKLLPRPIHRFSIYRGKGKKNYTVDIADSSLGIIIEYDGYWYHLDKERDEKRQKEIEEDGWKFLRYGGSKTRDNIPTLEQLKEDIQKVLKEIKVCRSLNL